jgi:acyl-CoA synthetase (NDP forming)
VLAADACEGWGLTVPALSKETRDRLREFLPKEAALANPVDMIATAPPESYGRALRVMLDDPDIDAVVFIYIPPLVTRPEDVARAVRGMMEKYDGKKPVLACFMMLQEPAVDLSVGGGRRVPLYVFPEDAVQALALAYKHAQYRDREEGRVVRFMDIDPDDVRKKLFGRVAPAGEGALLMPEEAAELFEGYGIPVLRTRAVLSPEEAAQEASRMGFPVAMKLRSRSILHKTDVGGVVLGLESEDDVLRAFQDIERHVSERGRGGEMQGVVLQPMAGKGREVIVGMVQDPVFGPLIMMGLGGVHVEVTKDIAFSLHPLTNVDPERMVARLRGKELLGGWRGVPPRDVEALRDVLLRFSALVDDFPEIDQMEINPLMLYEEGKGCAAVDLRVMLKEISSLEAGPLMGEAGQG